MRELKVAPAMPEGTALPDAHSPLPFQREVESYYCGRFSFAGETVVSSPDQVFALRHPSPAWRQERDSLDWIGHFCVAPRRLHTYYLARLLEGWAAHSASSWNMALETSRLNKLAVVLTQLAPYADEKTQGTFQNALKLQSMRVEQVRPRAAEDAVWQALSLLGIAGRQGFERLRGPALAQLSSWLPAVIQADGSAGVGEPPLELASALNDFLALNGAAPLPGEVMAACDRLYAYVAMFRLGAGQWSAAVAADVPKQLEDRLDAVHALSHASFGGRTLLRQMETRVLAHWGREFRQAYFEISQRGKPLFLVHGGADASNAPVLCAEYEGASEQGVGLSTCWGSQNQRHERIVYLAPDGRDVRFEERHQGETTRSVWIDCPANCKILRSQDREGANIYLADGTGWQLRVRDARISCGDSGRNLKITALDSTGCVQWALKKHPSARPRGGRSQKPGEGEGELPF